MVAQGDTAQKKQALRREMRALLEGISAAKLRDASTSICVLLSAFLAERDHSQRALHLLAWLPYFSGEVDLRPLLQRELKRRRVYLPHGYKHGNLEFVRLMDNWEQSLMPDELGLPAPGYELERFDHASSPQSVILVPGLAFDLKGRRLGRGKGFYDRILGRPEYRLALSVGVCLSNQILPDIPTDLHDVPVQVLCHEGGISSCSSQS